MLQLLLEHGDFLNIDISQGSVATNLRCGGIFTREFVANLSLILSAGEVMGKMGKSLVSCFLTHGVVILLSMLFFISVRLRFCQRVFTARCYASAVLAMGLCPSVCLCLCLCPSVTSRCSTKTAKRRITQTTPHDTPGTLVF